MTDQVLKRLQQVRDSSEGGDQQDREAARTEADETARWPEETAQSTAETAA